MSTTLRLAQEPVASHIIMPPAPNKHTLTRANLKTPRAAAVAGVVFSLLLTAALWLLRTAIPAAPPWNSARGSRPILAAWPSHLNLIPFACIAFLWFIGVLRDRLGVLEDRFFATVFFGSALLFLAMLFAGAAVIGAIVGWSIVVLPAWVFLISIYLLIDRLRSRRDRADIA
jgi:hypothetical protein